MPRVAHTVVDFFELPIAHALGIEVSITPTLGLGRSACTHSRSMIPCSSGSWAGETSLTPIVASAILSEAKNCTSSSTTATITISPGAGAGREQHADEHHVDAARAGTSSAASAPAGRCLCRSSIVAVAIADDCRRSGYGCPKVRCRRVRPQADAAATHAMKPEIVRPGHLDQDLRRDVRAGLPRLRRGRRAAAARAGQAGRLGLRDRVRGAARRRRRRARLLRDPELRARSSTTCSAASSPARAWSGTAARSAARSA